MRSAYLLLLAVLVVAAGACAGSESIPGDSATTEIPTTSAPTTTTSRPVVTAAVRLGEPIPLGTGDPAGLVAGSGRVWVLTATLVEPEDEFESEWAFTVRLLGLDEATQRNVDEFDLGELSNFEIQGLGYAADRLWTSANRQLSCDMVALECLWEGQVVTIDPGTGEITQMIEVEGRPHQIAVGLGSVWVGGDHPRGDGPSMEGSVRVDRIDPQTGAVVASIPVPGDYLAGPTVSSSGVWVTVSEETGRLDAPYDLVWIDPNTNQPEREWPLNDLYPKAAFLYMPLGMVAAFGDVWLDMMAPLPGEDLAPGEVLRIDQDGNAAGRLLLEGACRSMIGCLDHLWVIDAPAFPDGTGRLKGIDPDSNQVVADLDLAYLADVTIPWSLICGDQTLWIFGGSRPDETSPVELVLIPLVP